MSTEAPVRSMQSFSARVAAPLALAEPPSPPPPAAPVLTGFAGDPGAAGATSDTPRSTDWSDLLAGAAGALTAGAIIGWGVGRGQAAAVTGGLFAGGLWSLSRAVTRARTEHWAALGLLVAGGGASLYAGYRRNPRR